MCACTGRDDVHCMPNVQFNMNQVTCENCGHVNKNPYQPMSPVAPPEIQYPQHKECPECKGMMELVEWHNPTPIFGKTKSCDYRCTDCEHVERLKAYDDRMNLWINDW